MTLKKRPKLLLFVNFSVAVFASDKQNTKYQPPKQDNGNMKPIVYYRKIPKISPSKYKPLKIVRRKTLRSIAPSNENPLGCLYLVFALEYKEKQSKNGKFPSHYKLKISPSKRAFEKYEPRGLFSEFYGICQRVCVECESWSCELSFKVRVMEN